MTARATWQERTREARMLRSASAGRSGAPLKALRWEPTRDTSSVPDARVAIVSCLSSARAGLGTQWANAEERLAALLVFPRSPSPGPGLRERLATETRNSSGKHAQGPPICGRWPTT